MCVQVTKTANRFEISSLLEKILLKQVRWCLTFVGLYIYITYMLSALPPSSSPALSTESDSVNIMINHMIIIIVLFLNKEYYCRSCLVLNDNIDKISLQHDALFSVPTQLYYWHLHVSSFKKRSIFVNSDRHIHLLVRNLLSNQVELNPGPQSLADSSHPCSLFVPKNVHGILMQLYVTTVTNGVILDVLT